MFKIITTAIAAVMIVVLTYGFWHVSTNGWLTVSIRDVAEQTYESIKDAEIAFLDLDGNLLAEGESFGQYGVVYLKHPEIGFCVEKESRAPYSKDDREKWHTCYEKQVKWIIGWVGKVKYVDLKFDECRLKRIPVSVVESKESWWVWWVPLPHIGGKPITNFYLNIRVDRANCTVKNLWGHVRSGRSRDDKAAVWV